ncbi:hypothetical protein LguiA_033931 [Lonicera macranthoides]
MASSVSASVPHYIPDNPGLLHPQIPHYIPDNPGLLHPQIPHYIPDNPQYISDESQIASPSEADLF